MNYYLTPEPIAEALDLTVIRKSTAAGMYLLSEYDLVPYGIQKAVSEGAIELSDNLPPLPGMETSQETDTSSPVEEAANVEPSAEPEDSENTPAEESQEAEQTEIENENKEEE